VVWDYFATQPAEGSAFTDAMTSLTNICCWGNRANYRAIDEPGLAPMMDVNMMVMLAGRERSLAEYGDLFEASGMRVTNCLPIQTPMVIIEAITA
jgi:hypothetical protein